MRGYLEVARELFNAKVETETKDKIKKLIEKYKSDGLIQLDGDILDIAAELLERNLSVQTPRAAIGIEELDKLTSRINRLFVNFIEQNNTYIQTLQQEHEDKYEKAKLTIDGFIEEKQVLKEQFTKQTEKLNELTQLFEENQTIKVELEKEQKEKSKYNALLENRNEELESRIMGLLELEDHNKKLIFSINEKSDENHSLHQQIMDQKAALERQQQEHRVKIQEFEFHNKESLLILEIELTEKFNKHVDDIRKQRDQYVEKFNNKLSILQEKHENLFAENQKIQYENRSLLTEIKVLKEEYQTLKS